jgi:hypothetical protein
MEGTTVSHVKLTDLKEGHVVKYASNSSEEDASR